MKEQGHSSPTYIQLELPIVTFYGKGGRDSCKSLVLKELLVSSPVLAYPHFHSEYPFIVETDASTRGLGAVMAQQQADGQVQPIAFASHFLTVPKSIRITP